MDAANKLMREGKGRSEEPLGPAGNSKSGGESNKSLASPATRKRSSARLKGFAVVVGVFVVLSLGVVVGFGFAVVVVVEVLEVVEVGEDGGTELLIKTEEDPPGPVLTVNSGRLTVAP